MIAAGFYVFFIIVSSFEEIINSWLYYKRSVIGTDYIKEMTNLVIDASITSTESEKAQLPKIQKLEYKHIYFAYEKNREIFKDFSFTLNKGEITGILVKMVRGNLP